MKSKLSNSIKFLFLLVFTSCESNPIDYENIKIEGPENFSCTFIQEADFTLEDHSHNSKGEIIVAGSKWSMKKNENFFYGKINKDGKLSWKNNYGGNGHDKATALFVDDHDKTFVVGYKHIPGEDKDIRLDFVDKKGETIQKKQYHFNSKLTEEAYQIYSFQEDFIIAGFDKDQLNGFLFKLSKDGSPKERLSAGGPNKDYLFDVVKTNEDSLLSIGSYGSFHDLTGNDFNTKKSKIYLVKTNENLDLLWEKQLEYPGHAMGHKIINKSNNEFYLIASCQTDEQKSFQAMLIAIDAQGKKLWDSSMGGTSWDYAIDAITTNQYIYLLTNSGKEKSMIILYKLDGNGEMIDTYKYESSFDLNAKSISIIDTEIIIGANLQKETSSMGMIIRQSIN